VLKLSNGYLTIAYFLGLLHFYVIILSFLLVGIIPVNRRVKGST